MGCATRGMCAAQVSTPGYSLMPCPSSRFRRSACFPAIRWGLYLGPARARQIRTNSLTRRQRRVTAFGDISITPGFIASQFSDVIEVLVHREAIEIVYDLAFQ